MSREPRDPPGARPHAERESELLTAYIDGVTELSPEERRQIESQLADDPPARADETSLRGLLGQLRALPSEGDEPDWLAMERSIRDAVGTEVPRPWWRAWRWLVPMMSCATAAAVMMMLWSRPGPIRDPGVPLTPIARAPQAPQAVETPDEPGGIVPLWLDGAEVDVDLSAAELLPAPALDDDPSPSEADRDDLALLPASDLAWVDRLDDAALARAERWLASGPRRPDRSGGATPAAPLRKKT